MTAETWVLLRGLGREARHWEDFPRRLRSALGDVATYTPDLPGAGCCHGEPAPLAVAALAESARAQSLAAGARPPLRLLGLSLGGMVTVYWAARWPEEVRSLVVINTSLGRFSPVHHRLRPGILGLVLRAALARREQDRERVLLRMTAQNVEDPEGISRRWAAYARECPVTNANLLRQTLAAARFRGPAEPPLGDALVLRSLGDRMVRPECSARIAAAWDWALASHPWAGHDLPLEDPGWCVEAIAHWGGPAVAGAGAMLAGGVTGELRTED